ncbi:EAL domain-containing protein [Plesiomonas shigelloides subsp. oncorhynchi]|nr:EAL domain-containing protein [Plesiomonas shigelloides]
MDASTDKVVGFEALLRWQHKGDTICPSTFIDYAEKKALFCQLLSN